MRFYEVVARGEGTTGQVISSYWYRDVAAGLPDSGDQEEVLAAWSAQVQPKLLAIMPQQYRLKEVLVYSYDGDWNRVPFLPTVGARDLAGGQLTTVILPYNAIIYSAKVEPQQPGQKWNKERTAIVLKPVRRGYWSIGPIGEGWIDNNGKVEEAGYINLTVVQAFRAQLAANLTGVPFANPIEPIRVGQPPEGYQQKGYGLVRDVVIRPVCSTRRSRMFGKGA